MKILYVCKSLPHSFQGGIQTHVWKLSEWMLKLGHEVHILSAGSFKKGIQHIDMGGRKVTLLPYFPGRRLPFLPVVTEEMSFNLVARKWLLINQTRFDVIHLQGRSGCLFLQNKREVKVPVVNTLHGMVGIEYQSSVGRNNNTFDTVLHKKMAAQMEDFALQNADALIAVSQEMKSEIEVRNPDALDKTHIIYNGVDVPDLETEVPTDPNLLLFVGRLTALKGVFQLVEALQSVPDHIRLVMVGEGEARPELERLIQKYQLQHRITLTGALSGEQVEHWMRRCFALVLPSFHETQGIVLLEANAVGKPVIANAVGGVPEVVQDSKNGLLMGHNSPENIAIRVNYMFEHRPQAMRMGIWGRTFIREKFDWEKIAGETLQLYMCLGAGWRERLGEIEKPWLSTEKYQSEPAMEIVEK